jgi:hypothetical protein
MLNVICLKHGTKYGADYVNKLRNMVARHLTIDHRFVCLTDDTSQISRGIDIIDLPNDPQVSGWWWKPYIFKKGLFPKGDTNLFFDLDMVIVNSIDKLATYMPDRFVGLQDVGRVYRKFPEKLGSAVMKWPSGEYSNIWEDMVADFTRVKRMHGDQDWIWSLYKDEIVFFPEQWIMSYKWEIRKQSELIREMGRQIFAEIRNPEIPPDTSVLAFHGTPNPEDVQDPIIVDNWQ